MFESYIDVRTWLENFIPQVWTKQELGLGRIKYLLEILGRPQDKFKSIHVAGTSGKGSTAFYIAKLLQLTGSVTTGARGPVSSSSHSTFSARSKSIRDQQPIAVLRALSGTPS